MIANFYTQFTLETIFSITHRLRKENKTIGFVHGAFDLFHVGHMHLLEEARKKCDVLVVAIESDQNFTQYRKSFDQPVFAAKDRLRLVNQIGAVTLAFINELPAVSDSYRYLYKELRPSFLAIGRYFTAEDKIMSDVQKCKLKLIKIDSDLEIASRTINHAVKNVYQGLR